MAITKALRPGDETTAKAADRVLRPAVDVPVAERHPDCFFCGALMFTSGDLLVCPDDGSTFVRSTYLA